MLFADQLFVGESKVLHPGVDSAVNELSAEVSPPAYASIEVRAQVLCTPVADRGDHLSVLERTVTLPAFATCVRRELDSEPGAHVEFALAASRIPEVLQWVRNNMAFDVPASDSTTLTLDMYCVQHQCPLRLDIRDSMVTRNKKK